MWRYLIHTHSFSIPSYGTMMIVAYFVALFFVVKEAKRLKIEPSKVENLTIWILVGIVVGARIWYVLEHWSYYSSNLSEILKVWEGGLVFYGGFIGGVIGAFIYLRISHLSFSRTADAFGPGLAIAIGIGRIGCFLNGCCFGKITNSWIGIQFPRRWFPPVYVSQLQRGLIHNNSLWSLRVIPTQNISTIDLLVIFGILWYLRDKKPFEGFIFYLFLGLYSLHRFIIDFFRYYEGNALIFKVLTLSQVVSLGMIIFSIIAIIIGLSHKPQKI